MEEHWEVWIWNGKDWNTEEFRSEDPKMAEEAARRWYAQHKRVMPNCPARLVHVSIVEEHNG